MMKDNLDTNKRIYLSSPTMHGDEQKYIKEAFDTNWIAPLGNNVDMFESELALYVGRNHAVALSSGTAAIHLAVKLAGVAPGDIVFCTDFTFAATVNPVSYEGGTQVFIDSERDTWNMSPLALEKAFQKYDGSKPDRRKPKAVIIAHLYGTPAKLDEIVGLCQRYQVPLIEDAAESLSATYKGKQTGTFGKYSILSFNGNKIITTSGGGLLLSDDKAAIDKARFWATQARDKSPWYQHSEIGYNYRMSNVVAGIGRGQSTWINEHKRLKSAVYKRYERGLEGLPVTMNPFLPETDPNFWLSCITIDTGCDVKPDSIRLALERSDVECRFLWKPMHLQPIYAHHDFIAVDDEDVGADIFSRGLCLPSDIKMTEEDQQRVISIIRMCFA